MIYYFTSTLLRRSSWHYRTIKVIEHGLVSPDRGYAFDFVGLFVAT